MAKLTDAQQRVVNHDGGNILISASAGSGKTHTMIERVVRLVLEGKAKVSEILAVTFTEKAASDMRQKLKNALVDTYQKTKDARFATEINRLATADISTIHSFCARLIRLYFYKVGLSPDFKVADTSATAQILDSALDKTLREFYKSGDENFLELMDMHAVKRTDKEFRELLLDAYHFCTNEPNFEEFTEKYKDLFTSDGVDRCAITYKQKVNKKLKFSLNGLRECIAYFDSENLEKSKAFCEGVFSDIQEMIDVPDVYGLQKYSDYNRYLSVDKDLSEVAEEYKNLAVKFRDKAKKLVKDICSTLADKSTELQRINDYYIHIETFSKVLNRFRQVYSEEKREENLLDFADLEYFALEILKDDDIRLEVKGRYKYLFIDEYQDVNTVQEEILSRVADDNLLMVGDLKQGIYAFRGCRSEIFSRKLKTMPDMGQTVVRLNENFRSASAVIDVVNKIFGYCMTEEYFEENYAGNSDLVFGGLFPDGFNGRAEIHHLIKSEDKKDMERARVYDLLEEIKNPAKEENEDISALITAIINDELTKTVYDVKKQTERPITYGDIAILARAKNSEYPKSIVKGLLARGIPVISDAKENVCDFPEIAMLVNALKLLDCFLDDLPLASTLKGHIGGFTDEELYDVVSFYRESHSHGGFTDAYFYYLKNADTPLKDRLSEFDEYLKKIRFLSSFQGAHGALKKLVTDKDLESYLLSESNGKTRALRLKRFIMASVEGGRKLTVKEFLNKIEKSADSFSLFEGGEEDAVSVLTMHASKGLEFPVVISCGLERKFDTRDDKKEILHNRKYGFVPRYYDKQKRTKEKTLFRSAVIAEQAEERLKEEMRLFYVTATRATYSLHLIFCDDKDRRTDEFLSADRFYQFIPKSLPVTEHNPETLKFEKLARGRQKVLIGEYDKDRCKALKERFSYVYPFIEDTTLPLKSDVTSATKNFEEDVYRAVALFADEKTDIERGNVAHKIMENLDFSFKKSLSEQTSAMIERGILGKEEVEKVNLSRMEKAILTADLRSLSEGYSLYFEKEFLTEIEAREIFPQIESREKVLLQGIIDLLAIKGDKAKIVDYKYSKLDSDGLAKKYSKQLELYAYAVKKALDKEVEEKIIVNLFTGEVVKFN